MDESVTVGEAKRWLRARCERGEHCPVCTQFAKVYNRKLNSSMARGLIWLVKASQQGEWIHVPTRAPKAIVVSRELPKLEYWKLIESQLHMPDIARTSGIWRATRLGIDFAWDRVRVPKRVRLYDGRVLSNSEEQTGIREALGNHFNYNELMGRSEE